MVATVVLMRRYRLMSPRSILKSLRGAACPRLSLVRWLSSAPTEQPALSMGLTSGDAQCIPKDVRCCHPEYNHFSPPLPSWPRSTESPMRSCAAEREASRG
jgi:hypothetical protein